MSNNEGNQRNRQKQNNETKNETKNFYCRVIKDFYNKLFHKIIELYGVHEYTDKENVCSFYEFTDVERNSSAI